MTSSIRKRHGPAGDFGCRARGGRCAFTLVELLVVIGIILILIALLMPSLNAVWKTSVRTRVAMDLATIGTALEAYKQDHKDYPRVYADNAGPLVLTMALVGPGNALKDGQDGPGWRPRAGAKVQQPYLPVDKFKLVSPNQWPSPLNIDPNVGVLGDRWSNPILYMPGNTKAKIRQSTPPAPPEPKYVSDAPHVSQAGTAGGDKPMFNARVAGGYFDPNISSAGRRRLDIGTGLPRLQVVMGDVNRNNHIDGSESAAYEGPYLLWSAGPDEKYGPKEIAPVSPSNRCDDIANFPRREY